MYTGHYACGRQYSLRLSNLKAKGYQARVPPEKEGGLMILMSTIYINKYMYLMSLILKILLHISSFHGKRDSPL